METDASGSTGVRGGSAARWPRGASTVCAVVGAACLWAWGYVANLSVSLFPAPDIVASIGIEFAYYASQLTLAVLGVVLVGAVRRWHPKLPPAAVIASALTLAATAVFTHVYLGCTGGATDAALGAVPDLDATAVPGSGGFSPAYVPIVVVGVANGAAGMLLTIAWGARFSLGSRAMRRMVLLSFVLGYAIYLVNLELPHVVQTGVAVALPCVSGALWLFDSWRRHLLTAEVWPAGSDASGGRGEAAEGATSVSILPWRTMALFAAAAFVGNFIASFMMGGTYAGAEVIFPGAFIVAGSITLAATLLVGNGSRTLSIERLYRYDLPFAVLGMLLAMVAPAGMLPFAGALVSGASIFLQALVILKVTETTQETGMSPMLSFAVGQGLIGAVVFAGNVGGRIASELTAGDAACLSVVCAVGVFALFYLLVVYANNAADALAGATETVGELPAEGLSEPVDARGAAASPQAFRARVDAFAAELGLTPREADVLEHLLRGRSLAATAEKLFVTAGTVKTHTLHIYRKAGVGGRQELIDRFERAGRAR